MKKIFSSLIFLSLFFTIACNYESNDDWQVEGLAPIYSIDSDWQNTEVLGPQTIQQLGKFYYKDQHIFVNDLNKGIHIVDNSNPENPVFIKFIKVAGSKDISIKNNYLYTDNVTDLLVFDISDFNNITMVNRVPDIYPPSSQNFPEFSSNVYFECVDEAQGLVIGWETQLLTNPQCYR